MIRRILPVAVAALAGTVLSAPPAVAAHFAAPTLDLVDGQTVGQLAPLTVTGLEAEAESVRVAFASLPVEVWPVVDGAAAGTLETWGLTGPATLEVSQCQQTGEGPDCGTPAAISVTVDNPEPTYTPSREGTQRTHDFTMTVGLDVTSGDPRLSVGLDDGQPSLVDPGHALAVDVDGLAEGAHDVRAAVCSADGTRCTASTSGAFEVVRTVEAEFSVAPPVFSPNADGRSDVTTFTYGLVDPWESAVLRVRLAGAEGAPLLAAPIEPPAGPGGEASVEYGGTDQEGGLLPAGDYTASLTVSRTLDGQAILTTYSVPFTIDLQVLLPTGLTPNRPQFYPHDDGYRDTTRLSWTDGEPYARVDLEVRNSANQAVRLVTGVEPDTAVWDGRDNSGDLVPAGSYSIRLRAFDQAGNEGWSAPVPVTLSRQVVATRTRSVAITPKAARVSGGAVGECSAWRVPSVHGWTGSASYLSNVKCNGDFDESLVWTVQRIRLPEAVKYRRVQLSWYGGPTYAWTRDTALATVYDREGAAMGWFNSVDYLASQHLPWYPAADVVKDGRVKWAFSTSASGPGDLTRYDVKKFTVTYRADVLVDP